MSEDDHAQQQQQQRPYRLFSHPGVTFLDALLSYVTCNLVLGFSKFGRISNRKDSNEDAVGALRSLRRTTSFVGSCVVWLQVRAWNLTFRDRDPLLEWTLRVPRIDSSTADETATRTNGRDDDDGDDALDVRVLAASKYVDSNSRAGGGVGSHNTGTLAKEAVEADDGNVQIVLWFWGGGGTVKTDFGFCADLARSVFSSERNQRSQRRSAR